MVWVSVVSAPLTLKNATLVALKQVARITNHHNRTQGCSQYQVFDSLTHEDVSFEQVLLLLLKSHVRSTLLRMPLIRILTAFVNAVVPNVVINHEWLTPRALLVGSRTVEDFLF